MKLIRKYRVLIIVAMQLAAWLMVGSHLWLDPVTAKYIRIPCYPVILLGVVALATVGDERPSS